MGLSVEMCAHVRHSTVLVRRATIPGKRLAGTRVESSSIRQSFAWIPQAVSVMLGKVGRWAGRFWGESELDDVSSALYLVQAIRLSDSATLYIPGLFGVSMRAKAISE